MADHARSTASATDPLSVVLEHPLVRELIDSLVWVVQGLEATFGYLFGDDLVERLVDEVRSALTVRGSSAGRPRATGPGRRLTST